MRTSKEIILDGAIEAVEIINKAQRKHNKSNNSRFDWQMLEHIRVYMINQMTDAFAEYALEYNSKTQGD